MTIPVSILDDTFRSLEKTCGRKVANVFPCSLISCSICFYCVVLSLWRANWNLGDKMLSTFYHLKCSQKTHFEEKTSMFTIPSQSFAVDLWNISMSTLLMELSPHSLLILTWYKSQKIFKYDSCAQFYLLLKLLIWSELTCNKIWIVSNSVNQCRCIMHLFCVVIWKMSLSFNKAM